MTIQYRFLDPIDVLFLRGNKLFGDAGSYGDSQIPPWPSAIAGALRSRILVDDGIDLSAFARGEVAHACLGTPSEPGPFVLAAFSLARQKDGRVESIHPLPADLMASRTDGKLRLARCQPQLMDDGIQTSSPTPRLAALSQSGLQKPLTGVWLTQDGWQLYLDGRIPDGDQHCLGSEALWSIDERVGIALEAERRRVDDGKLFTMQAVAFRTDVGFLAGVRGAAVPENGLLRLGGDGRGARLRGADRFAPAQPDFEAIARSGRCRIVLTSPGIFGQGWKLPGTDVSNRWSLAGVSGRITCAAVARPEVVSGWDLARWRPKAAHRAAPAGSVYWIDDLNATAEQLRKLSEAGLFSSADDNPQRRAEGFNRFTFALA
jgi:CRISPR-associated protein Cmr3